MNNLILVRHGQSKFNLERRFTGFYDIDLTSRGEFEAKYAGELIKKLNLKNGKSELFLDLTDRVHHPRLPGDERGLLGFTFSPDYEISKSFYVNYVNKENETIISRFNFISFNISII